MKIFSKIFQFFKKIFEVKQKCLPVKEQQVINYEQNKEKFISSIRIDEIADENELKNIFNIVLDNNEMKNKNKDELIELEKRIKKNIDVLLRKTVSQYEEIEKVKYDLRTYKKQENM